MGVVSNWSPVWLWWDGWLQTCLHFWPSMHKLQQSNLIMVIFAMWSMSTLLTLSKKSTAAFLRAVVRFSHVFPINISSFLIRAGDKTSPQIHFRSNTETLTKPSQKKLCNRFWLSTIQRSMPHPDAFQGKIRVLLVLGSQGSALIKMPRGSRGAKTPWHASWPMALRPLTKRSSLPSFTPRRGVFFV